MCAGQFSPVDPRCPNVYSQECGFCQIPDPMVNPNHMPGCAMLRVELEWWAWAAQNGWSWLDRHRELTTCH